MRIAALAACAVALASCAGAPEGSQAWAWGSEGERVEIDGREFKVIRYDEPDAWAAYWTGVGTIGNTAKFQRDGAEAVERVSGCEAVDASSYASLVDVFVSCE